MEHKKLKTRTKFVIIAIVSLYACFFANIILSMCGKEMLSDAFCVAWVSAFTCELGLLYGLRVQDKRNGE